MHETVAGPFIVKPRRGGSSIGIEVVADLETARRLIDTAVHFAEGAVVEPYLDGWTDLNISVRTHPTLELTPVEKPLRSSERVYSYKEKYLSQSGHGLEHAARELPAQVPASVTAAIEESARRLADPLMLRGISRLDFLWNGDDRVLFNEVNTIPGAMSLYLWRAAGHSAADVGTALVAEARANPAVRWNVGGADGLALRAGVDRRKAVLTADSQPACTAGDRLATVPAFGVVVEARTRAAIPVARRGPRAGAASEILRDPRRRPGTPERPEPRGRDGLRRWRTPTYSCARGGYPTQSIASSRRIG